MTARERFIRAVLAEPAILAGRTKRQESIRVRSATDRGARRFYFDASFAGVESPDGYGDRAVWSAWDRIRAASNCIVRPNVGGLVTIIPNGV